MTALSRLLVVMAVLGIPSGLTAQVAARPECAHDREAILSLDFVAFDQTQGSGWRPLYDAGCYQEVAELLRDWAARNAQVPPIIAFHEAQAWGYAGRSDVAVRLFEQILAENPAGPTDPWKLYTEGNLAFLQRDKARMEAATAALAALPKPAGWDNARVVTADGKPAAPLAWPPNLAIMQAMLRCWDRTYEVAAHCHLPEWRRPAGSQR